MSIALLNQHYKTSCRNKLRIADPRRARCERIWVMDCFV